MKITEHPNIVRDDKCAKKIVKQHPSERHQSNLPNKRKTRIYPN